MTVIIRSENTVLTDDYLQAPEKVYKRIVKELKSIRKTYPALEKITVRPHWDPQDLTIGFDDDGAAAAAVKDGSYNSWDALNKKYGVINIATDYKGLFTKSINGVTRYTLNPSIPNRSTLPFVHLRFASRYNIPLLAAQYAKLPNVRSSQPDKTIGGGDSICLTIKGDTHLYFFNSSWGDCESGCQHSDLWGFEVTKQGYIKDLGKWGEWDAAKREPVPRYSKSDPTKIEWELPQKNNDPLPTWIDAFRACRNRDLKNLMRIGH